MPKKEGSKGQIAVPKSTLKEIARDTLALGGLAFFVLVVARASIGPYWSYVCQLLIAFIALFLLSFLTKNSENRVSRALILGFFTILFYNEIRFTVFAVIVLLAVLASAVYLKIEKIAIGKGILLSAISTAIGYYLAPIILNLLKIQV